MVVRCLVARANSVTQSQLHLAKGAALLRSSGDTSFSGDSDRLATPALIDSPPSDDEGAAFFFGLRLAFGMIAALDSNRWRCR